MHALEHEAAAVRVGPQNILHFSIGPMHSIPTGHWESNPEGHGMEHSAAPANVEPYDIWIGTQMDEWISMPYQWRIKK